MAERLAILKHAPERVVDWGAQFGASEGAFRRANGGPDIGPFFFPCLHDGRYYFPCLLYLVCPHK